MSNEFATTRQAASIRSSTETLLLLERFRSRILEGTYNPPLSEATLIAWRRASYDNLIQLAIEGRISKLSLEQVILQWRLPEDLIV